jgi:hypothetical protein
MDAATAWLKEHDPEYATSRLAWKDLDDDGAYQTPAQEIPAGLIRGNEEIVLMVDNGTAQLVQPIDYKACLNCGRLYQPTVARSLYCSDTCQAKRRRERDRAAYMRDYRRRKAA